PETQGLKPLAIIGRALGPKVEKAFALLRKLFDPLLQINSAPIYVVHPAYAAGPFFLDKARRRC
ncbi:MAG: hypothetical protein ACLFUS_15040, partial [Candidatus Sumerlaeia bacterium]